MKMKRVLLITILALSLSVIFALIAAAPSFNGSGVPAASAVTTTKITEYEVMYSSNGFVPRIWLKAGGAYIGQLIFRSDGTTLPADSMSGAQYNLYYHLADFQNCLDLLRSENPVYILWAGAGVGNENGIKTMAEPVGEGENAPALTVTSPNGGQNWARSSVHSITWKSVGSPGAYVKIELLKAGVVSKTLSTSTENDGSFSWTISSTQTVGTDYKIRITSTSITPISDSSDSNFAIT
jgi:hypothetical protein